MKIFKTILLSFFIISCVTAQEIHYEKDSTAVAFKNHDLYIPFDNRGMLASVNIDPLGSYLMYKNVNVLRSAGFIISGYIKNKMWICGNAHPALIEDFIPGKVQPNSFRKSKKIFHLSSQDKPFSNSWKQWKYAVNLGADYYDGDKNGIYNPIDLNKDGRWQLNEDRPGLLYDNTFFCVYNDGTPTEYRIFTKMDPLGIEIKQTIFASSSIPDLQNTIFIKYSITNTGLVADTLERVIFSLWQDADLGEYHNDLIGCDTLLNSAVAYNDPTENSFEGDYQPVLYSSFVQMPYVEDSRSTTSIKQMRGSFLGYNEIPNSSYVKLLSHTTPTETGTTWPGNPTLENRHQALGLDLNGNPVDPCDDYLGDVFDEDCNSVNSKFWFSGDPETSKGWLNTVPYDYQDQLSTNFFKLIKDQPQEIIIAYTVGQGYYNVSSFAMARYRVGEIIKERNANFPRSFSTDNLGYDPGNLSYAYKLKQNYPNPFNPQTKISFSISGTNYFDDPTKNKLISTELIVYDIMGRKVQTLLKEQKYPGDYEVTFDATQLASGVYLYRLTAGNFVQTKKMLLIK